MLVNTRLEWGLFKFMSLAVVFFARCCLCSQKTKPNLMGYFEMLIVLLLINSQMAAKTNVLTALKIKNLNNLYASASDF